MRSVRLRLNGAGSADLGAIADEWRELAARALEPNVFYEPAFALAAAPVFGRDAGAVLVWSGTHRANCSASFRRAYERRYGFKLPILAGWTHPYAPLGTPLIERDAAEPVIAAWLAHLPGSGAAGIAAAAAPRPRTARSRRRSMPFSRRVQMPNADFARHRRALLEPREPLALPRACALAASAARVAPHRAAPGGSGRVAVHRDDGAARRRRCGRGFPRA